MGSGSNVDVCCITKGPTIKFERGVKIGASRVQPPLIYDFPIGNTRNPLLYIYIFTSLLAILGECSKKLDKKPKKKVETEETEMEIEK